MDWLLLAKVVGVVVLVAAIVVTPKTYRPMEVRARRKYDKRLKLSTRLMGAATILITIGVAGQFFF